MSKNFINFESYTIGAGIHIKNRTALRVGRAIIPFSVIGSVYTVLFCLSALMAIIATSVTGIWSWGWWMPSLVLLGLVILGVVLMFVIIWIMWMLDEVDDAASGLR